ncbi:hypothetical protein VNI00_006939 [Paramarasmius palmivorus]|uniref:Uncharacterized protein n=1 Tax=Paramarasmius palmivorus TaxID=297713 RepID=A0AAW0D2L7_9AGAR
MVSSASVNNAPQDLWLQRSRLDGIVLAAFVYGIFFHLSIQAYFAVYKGSQPARKRLRKQQACVLYVYLLTTFILGTICFACNARYTEDIWINFKGQRSTEDLIIHEFDFWWNRMAVACNFIMIWIMDLLLLHRCFVIWHYNVWVVALMTALYFAVVGLSIVVMYYAQHAAVFSSIQVQIAFLTLSCTYNLLFTILVSARLLVDRKRIIDALGKAHARAYTFVTATIVESAALYFIFDVIFLIAFGLKSHAQNLIMMESSSIQGIAGLLIIVRVARGQDFDSTMPTSTRPSLEPRTTSRATTVELGVEMGTRVTH